MPTNLLRFALLSGHALLARAEDSVSQASSPCADDSSFADTYKVWVQCRGLQTCPGEVTGDTCRMGEGMLGGGKTAAQRCRELGGSVDSEYTCAEHRADNWDPHGLKYEQFRDFKHATCGREFPEGFTAKTYAQHYVDIGCCPAPKCYEPTTPCDVDSLFLPVRKLWIECMGLENRVRAADTPICPSGSELQDNGLCRMGEGVNDDGAAAMAQCSQLGGVVVRHGTCDQWKASNWDPHMTAITFVQDHCKTLAVSPYNVCDYTQAAIQKGCCGTSVQPKCRAGCAVLGVASNAPAPSAESNAVNATTAAPKTTSSDAPMLRSATVVPLTLLLGLIMAT